uniref:Uncharacterized protein n=1 Tax=Yangshan Harbor Nitrososphaeria virus TaxID=2969597 RepID=A0A976UB52_9CAUD|nr:hypothetical protein [Yangshan Harbor Nitrososphaeria virus]
MTLSSKRQVICEAEPNLKDMTCNKCNKYTLMTELSFSVNNGFLCPRCEVHD